MGLVKGQGISVYKTGDGEVEVVIQCIFREKVPLYILAKFRGLWAIALLHPHDYAGPAIIVKSWQEATFSHARMEYIQNLSH